jgi:hypothetical protein
MLSRLDRIRLLDGMTDDHADALAALGLDTYWEIHRLRPDTLLSMLETLAADGSLAKLPDMHTVVRWQKNAVRHGLTRILHVRVRSARLRTPLAGALVVAGDVEGVTDEAGDARLIGVSPAAREIVMTCDGYYDLHYTVDLRDEVIPPLTFSLARSRSGGRSPIHVSEYDGYLLEVGPRDSQHVRDRRLEEIPAGALLLIAALADDGACLVSLMRTRDGRTIYTDRTEVAPSRLPPGAHKGELLEWSGVALARTALTREQLAEQRAQQKFGFPTPLKWPRVNVDGIDAEQLSGAVTVPPVDHPSSLTAAQRAAFARAVSDHPDGVPLSVLSSALTR